MIFKKQFLIPALALFFAVQASALPILVGEFDPPNSGDATEHVAARTAIETYNSANNPDLSQLFGPGTDPALINGWEVFVAKTTETDAFEGASEKILSFTAPGTYAEYYVFSKYGQGQANFDSALHHMLAGDVLSYNPGGASAPNGLSHLAIWGRGTTTNVPDSGLTIALFGAGLMLLGVMKRRTAA